MWHKPSDKPGRKNPPCQLLLAFLPLLPIFPALLAYLWSQHLGFTTYGTHKLLVMGSVLALGWSAPGMLPRHWPSLAGGLGLLALAVWTQGAGFSAWALFFGFSGWALWNEACAYRPRATRCLSIALVLGILLIPSVNLELISWSRELSFWFVDRILTFLKVSWRRVGISYFIGQDQFPVWQKCSGSSTIRVFFILLAAGYLYRGRFDRIWLVAPIQALLLGIGCNTLRIVAHLQGSAWKGQALGPAIHEALGIAFFLAMLPVVPWLVGRASPDAGIHVKRDRPGKEKGGLGHRSGQEPGKDVAQSPSTAMKWPFAQPRTAGPHQVAETMTRAEKGKRTRRSPRLSFLAIHARRDTSRIVENPIVRATPRSAWRSSGDSVPRPLAGLCPAPTREPAQLPVATNGNGIAAHIFVRWASLMLGISLRSAPHFPFFSVLSRLKWAWIPGNADPAAGTTSAADPEVSPCSTDRQAPIWALAGLAGLVLVAAWASPLLPVAKRMSHSYEVWPTLLLERVHSNQFVEEWGGGGWILLEHPLESCLALRGWNLERTRTRFNRLGQTIRLAADYQMGDRHFRNRWRAMLYKWASPREWKKPLKASIRVIVPILASGPGPSGLRKEPP